MPNLAALHAAIFLLSAKNRWGAHMCPPPAVRGLRIFMPLLKSKILKAIGLKLWQLHISNFEL